MLANMARTAISAHARPSPYPALQASPSSGKGKAWHRLWNAVRADHRFVGFSPPRGRPLPGLKPTTSHAGTTDRTVIAEHLSILSESRPYPAFIRREKGKARRNPCAGLEREQDRHTADARG